MLSQYVCVNGSVEIIKRSIYVDVGKFIINNIYNINIIFKKGYDIIASACQCIKNIECKSVRID